MSWENLMSKEVVSRDEVIGRLGNEGYFKGVLSGRVSTRESVTREQLEKILEEIKTVFTSEEQNRSQQDNSQVYIVTFELPFGDPRIKFMTLYHNHHLGNNIQDLNADILERDGFVGTHSLEDIAEVFSGCALPHVPALKTKQPSPDPGRTPPKSVPKQVYEFLVDPALIDYLRGHKGYLVTETFRHGPSSGKGKTIDTFEKIGAWYHQYEACAVGIAGLTPIPYKIFTIAGGAFQINFVVFCLASVASRGLRFIFIGWMISKYGSPVKSFIYKYFNLLTILFVILLIGGFVLLKYII